MTPLGIAAIESAATYSCGALMCVGLIYYTFVCQRSFYHSAQNGEDLILIKKDLFESMQNELIIKNQPPPTYVQTEPELI